MVIPVASLVYFFLISGPLQEAGAGLWNGGEISLGGEIGLDCEEISSMEAGSRSLKTYEEEEWELSKCLTIV